jgi:hypothetical protein
MLIEAKNEEVIKVRRFECVLNVKKTVTCAEDRLQGAQPRSQVAAKTCSKHYIAGSDITTSLQLRKSPPLLPHPSSWPLTPMHATWAAAQS